MYRLGIDLGGTKTEAVLLDSSLSVIDRKRVSTPKDDYDSILESIFSLSCSLTNNLSEFSVGICTPGTISKKTGLIKNSNTQVLIGKPLKQDLEKKFNQKISMENDANCFAIAEHTMGAAMEFNVVFGVIMGTGVGGGLVVNGNLHLGRNNIAGEWGHHTLHRNGNLCYCGKRGCVETYISGPALEKKWYKMNQTSLPLSDIIEKSDPLTIKWKNEFLEDFGYALANVIDILDPDVVVLGGGLSNIGFLYDEGKSSVYQKVFSDYVDTPILKNKLGDSAGVFGAALLSD